MTQVQNESNTTSSNTKQVRDSYLDSDAAGHAFKFGSTADRFSGHLQLTHTFSVHLQCTLTIYTLDTQFVPPKKKKFVKVLGHWQKSSRFVLQYTEIFLSDDSIDMATTNTNHNIKKIALQERDREIITLRNCKFHLEINPNSLSLQFYAI